MPDKETTYKERKLICRWEVGQELQDLMLTGLMTLTTNILRLSAFFSRRLTFNFLPTDNRRWKGMVFGFPDLSWNKMMFRLPDSS